jgi:hypothetical protein
MHLNLNNNPFYNLPEEPNKTQEEGIPSAQNSPRSQLYQNLIKFNETLKNKEQELIKARIQMLTLEKNINSQVDEFLKSLSVTNLNLQARFVEIKRNNQELRSIKDYILGSSLNADVFSHKKVIQTLNVDRMEDLYESDRNKSLDNEVSNPHPSSVPEKRIKIEEDKFNYHQKDKELRIDVDGAQISDKKMAVESNRKLTNFEDDDFKLNFNHKFNSPKKKKLVDDIDRIRATSSSVLEASVNPHFLNLQSGAHGKNKQVKHSESQQIASSGKNNLIPTFGMQAQPPSLPFLPNVQIDPEIICQMLIRKLATNNGLVNLNDICRIFPDSILNRTRSNTE